MNGKQLKNSILQLAIQGKLVPQDPADEPASVLLAKIRKEKEQLVKEGKLKKKDLVCEPITDEEKPFEIPESWEWCRLGELISISSGDGLTSNQMIPGGIPVYGGNGITGYHNKANVFEPSVVIGRVGFYCGSVHETSSEAWVTDNAFITKYPSRYINKHYLIYILRYLDLGKQHNATAQPVVSGKKIYPLLFPLPPLSEQHRIVEKIEELMPLVEEYDKAQTKLNELNEKLPEALKKSILQEAIQGKLVPQDPADEPASALLAKIRKEKEQLVKEGKLKKKDLETAPISDEEKPFEIPESWEWVRMKEFLHMIGGTSYSKNDIKAKGIRILRGGNIQDLKLIIADDDVFVTEKLTDSEKNIKKGDIIIVASTGSFSAIGKPAFIKEDYPNTQIGAFLRILRPFTLVVVPFIQLIFMGEYYRKQLLLNVKGTNINNIKASYIDDMLIPLPPLSEQHRIVEKIEELFATLK